LTGPVLHRFDNGILIEDDLIIPVQRARYAACNLHEPEEEAWFHRLLADHRPGQTFRFWDVGAGVGYYGLLVTALIPGAKVTAFEPLPAHAAAITRHWRLNGRPDRDLAILPLAASDRDGQARFVAVHYGSHLATDRQAGDLVVRTAPLAPLLARLGVPVDLMKIDVQGAELAVLQGLWPQARMVRSWIVGTHGPDIHLAVSDWFRRLGATILCDEKAVPGQPDGLVVARSAD
jgi:FkbM family methyltransferase